MSRYALIRGWIECSHEDVKKIKKIISSHWGTSSKYLMDPEPAAFYQKGWFFPDFIMNWTSFIFYGGCVNAGATRFFKDCFSKIAESGLDVNGTIYVDIEDEENLLWSFDVDNELKALFPNEYDKKEGLIETKRD